MQPSQILAPRVFPSLPYSDEILQHPTEFHFQYPDANVSEQIHLRKVFVEKKHPCYAS